MRGGQVSTQVYTPSRVKTASPSLWKRLFNQEAITAYIFILPSLIGFMAFFAIPAVRAFQISFTEWNLLRAPKYIGFENYQELMADPVFWNSLKVTLQYVLWNIPLQTVLALFIAVVMDRVTKSVLVRGIFVIPYLLSNVIVALIWLWLLDPNLGFFNLLIQKLGLGKQPFFVSIEQAIPTIAGVNVWRHMGLNALLFYAGIQSIPKSLYEAATIDGAGEWAMFRKITLPLLRPVTVFVLVTSIVGSFQIFDTVAVTTQGGPVDASRVIVYYIVQNAFSFSKFGYASAMAVVLFLILVIVTILQMRVLRGNSSDLSS
jgi:multiple sugar transport system permease protein